MFIYQEGKQFEFKPSSSPVYFFFFLSATMKVVSLIENRYVVFAKGVGDRVGWTGSLGLVDANYYT